MTDNDRYLVAGCKSWNRQVFDNKLRQLPGSWQFVGRKEELTLESARDLDPRYVFFLHWSWHVPDELLDAYECVCFHMTDVPYGRGGSPLQNLIVRGHRETMLTALRMTTEFDAGPVYLKRPLSLESDAEEILIRASRISAEMIAEIVESCPTPKPQQGDTVAFKRRTPEQGRIEDPADLGVVHDFIRMLDAEGYPKAFIDHQGFRYEFSRSALRSDCVLADVRVTHIQEDDQ